MRAVTELEFGIVYVNVPTIGAEVQLAVQRHEVDRQRLPRGRSSRARRVQRVDGRVDQPPPAEGAVPAGRVTERCVRGLSPIGPDSDGRDRSGAGGATSLRRESPP